MIISTFKYTLKREIRDYTSMLLMVFFPAILALIVGNALQGDFQAPKTEKYKVALIEGDMYMESLKSVFAAEAVSNITETIILNNHSEADNALLLGEIHGYIWYDSDEINFVVEDPELQGVAIITFILTQFTRNQNIFTHQNVNYNDYDVIGNRLLETYIQARGLSNNHIPRAFDYYGVTLTVLVCLFGSLYAIKIISDTLIGRKQERLLSVTNRLLPIYIGVLLASILLVAMQISVLLIFYKMVYGVFLGSNYFRLIAILFIFIIFSNLFGLALISVVKDYGIAYTLANIIILGSTFLAGGFVIIDLDHFGAGRLINQLLPNAVCQNVLFSTIYETNSVSFIEYIQVMAAGASILIIVAVLTNKRRLAK
ncbi:MAG: ABC transporter permease [Lachnospiraceae bacterium]|nr:ABC transporter permease [Lachnospiraceae bacterium]